MDLISLLREPRIGPFTVFDLATAYGGIYLLAPALTALFNNVHVRISRAGWLWFTLPIGELFHYALHVQSPVLTMLASPPSSYLTALVLAGMVYMGIRSSRRSAKAS